MITLLLDLLAIDAFFGFLGNRAQLKRVRAAQRAAQAFVAWASANPQHPLVKRVEAEIAAINQSLTMSREQKVWALAVIAENAYAQMRATLPDRRNAWQKFFDWEIK